MLTLTASEGNQEAVEERDRRLGRFTSRLLEALAGSADSSSQGGNGDGLVTLQETIQYVTEKVSSDSAQDADSPQQFPTAGPVDLLEFVRLPLTRSTSPSTSGG